MLIAELPAGLCLDYANTLAWRGRETPAESLQDFAGLVTWLRQRGAVDRETATDAKRWARERPAAAAKQFAQAIGLREALYRAFSAVAAGHAVPVEDFHLVQEALAQAPARSHLVCANRSFGWEVAMPSPTVPALLAPVLWSAADLLVTAGRQRVRRCANDACLWLFLDVSRNGTRRWCDMASCGNRAKARRHYLKHKQA
ncbi:MAG TPA: ABATE domain-containing protein [Hyphomicrobiaceae bacterium]|jgi:predicted RNA-binding Zn ribbon-like protein|nr:ABATE domain-containing protein [Hyphomicrobiaceae bacterium]